MSLRPLNRGTSILAALVFIALLGGVAVAVNSLAPASPLSQTAQANVTQIIQRPSPESSGSLNSNSPKDCTSAIQAALNQTTGSAVVSTDKGKAGTVDACFGAVSKTGKPSNKASDYQCVGRSGKLVFADDTQTVTSSPDKTVPAGTCKIQVCTGSTCSQASLYKGGIQSTDKGVVSAGIPGETPGTSGVPGVGSANGSDNIGNAFQSPEEYQKAIDQSIRNANSDKIVENLDKIGKIDSQLAGCSLAESQSCPGNAADLQKQKDALLAENDALQKQMASLGESKAGLGAYAKVDCSSGDCLGVAETPAQKAQLERQGFSCEASAGGSGYDCIKTKDPANRQPTPQPRPSTFQPPPGGPGGSKETPSGSGGGLPSGLSSLLGGLLQGFAKGMQQSAGQGSGQACPSDPNAYAQQQQQYNQQLQQYNMQLQQYNYQYQYSQYSGYPPPPPPLAPQSCTPNNNSNTCAATPAQPTGSCAGSWQPIRTQQSNGATCTTGWQCVPSNVTTPTAQISCNPLVADTGMSVAIAFSCTNATGSTGQGFDTANATSGSATATLGTTTSATTTTFGITCVNQTLTANAQCSVQVGRPAIVLVATPKIVAPGKTSAIGWVTSGMQSCVVSSPTLVDFTAQNATNTSPSGVATTPALATSTDFLLSCASVGDSTKTASTTVIVSATSSATTTSQ